VVQEIVLDCADPAALAQFWAGLLESRWALLHPGWAVVDADPVLIAFQQVPEPKSSPKNRLHRAGGRGRRPADRRARARPRG
jgi:hypothetical protein